MEEREYMPIAVFVSGRGTNLQAIIDAINKGKLKAEIKLVLSNTSKAYALERARKYNIPTKVIPSKKFKNPIEWGEKLIEVVKESGVDLVVLAGFMKILPPNFISAFPNKIINIHPSILPAFKGLAAQEQAFNYGVKYTGCTVHIVTEKLDEGPIIAQAVVPVLPNDNANTLANRILKYEHKIYPQVIQWFAEKRVKIEYNKTVILGAKYGSYPFNPELEIF